MCRKKSVTKKLAILTAADKVFRKFGFTKTRMNDIADLAGLSVGCIYLYFQNKEAIFIHLAKEDMSIVEDMIKGATQP